MGVSGVLGRFTLIYMVLIIAMGAVLHFLGAGGNSGVNIAILLVTVFWMCSAFAKKNGRYFDKSEKTKVVVGLILINITIQGLFGAAVLIASGGEISSSVMLFSVGFVGLLHAVAIYFFVGIVRKMLLKQGVISA